MPTFNDLLDPHRIVVPDDLDSIEVPVLTGPQRQGDVGVFPRPALGAAEPKGSLVPAEGVAVVVGEATRNMHLLQSDGPVFWSPAVAQPAGSVLLGILDVPDGSTAWLIHTDEHGVNGIGPGCYRLTGKRTQLDEIRRVAD